MILRVLTDDKATDISLTNQTTYSIGTGKKDDYRLYSDKVQKEHVKLLKEEQWIIECRGETYLHGEPVKSSQVAYNAAYVLSPDDKISVVCMDETVQQKYLCPLGDKKEIAIGRTDDNDIILHSTLTSKHHAVLKKIGTEYHICDKGSTNGTYVNEKRVREIALSPMDKISIGENTLVFRGDSLEIYAQAGSVHYELRKEKRTEISKDTVFQRAPRLKKELPVEPTEIAAPPPKATKPEINFLTTFLPALGTIGIAVVMTVVMGNSMMLIYTLPMTLIGVITSVISFIKQNKKYKATVLLREEKYLEYLKEKENEIQRKQSDQRQALLEANPDTNTCFAIADAMDRRLWARRPQDADFMSVRIGKGVKESSFKIVVPKDAFSLEEDALRSKAAEIYTEYNQVSDLPVTCDILRNQVCGIVGNHDTAMNVLNTMMAQIATHHSYTEVKMAVMYDRKDENSFSWTRDLPHVQNTDKSMSYSASDKQTADKLLAFFADQLKQRKLELDEKDSFGKKAILLPYCLFVFAQPDFLGKKHIINEYLFKSRDLSAGVIMLVDDIDQLPKECNLIIEVKKDGGIFYHKENVAQKQKFLFDNFEMTDCTRFANIQNHLICDEAISKSTIPAKYSFFEMLGINSVDELDIASRWERSNIRKSMAVPIGIGEGGKTISLDIHELGHGPHGLLAGTTGSGKSEVLQSFILSLALQFSPAEVGFVIIDFKGGGMANQFVKLPHLRGTITNIEGNAIKRSLASIKAELVKRQKVFAESNVNSIDGYIEKYKKGQAKVAIPHLVIIVDEFAELKAEQPEFMKELISVARIGRSLGIHLILATQKPAGQVSEQIWSNSRFRICLKVASREDSNEMLKSPLAANIKETGRAYLQVGNNEIFELFQNGYSGGEVFQSRTQLDVLVDKVASYCIEEGIQQIPPICCAPLPDSIVCPETEKPREFGEVMVGLLDAPSMQYQGPITINVAKNNTLVVGASQTGKTNLIQSTICQLSRTNTPDEINIYVIDLGAMTLRIFEHLNHVGGVVTAMDQERLKNLFKLLSEEIEHRKQIFLECGVSSYIAYREDGGGFLPLIVVFADNLSAFRELFGDQYEDMLLRFMRDGVTYGITFMLTNSQASGISYKYMSHIGNRIAFTCNDTSEYGDIFGRCKEEPADLPGRALISVDKDVYEVQTYLAFDGKTEAIRSATIRNYVKEVNINYNAWLETILEN